MHEMKSLSRTMQNRSATLALVGACLIVLMTFAAYIPAMRGGFIWDDDQYVTQNSLLIAPDGLIRIWLSLDSPSQYFPLVYTMFRFERAIWGLNPLGYHIVNVLLHALSALLVWAVLRRLSIKGAWIAAAIFALHPVNVESAAWITERKNVLSTFFYLLTVLAWLRYRDQSATQPEKYYKLALAFFALALFSKTTACTLPVVLLLLAWFKRERVNRRTIEDLAPFFGFALVMGFISVWWERSQQGTAGQEFAFTAVQRVLIASHALWFYLGKLVRPHDLAFSYPKWEINAADPRQYLWLAACIVAAVALWLTRRRLGRGPITAAAFFVVSLVPMLGFFSLYTFRYTFVADHYQYVASIGPIALFSALIARTWRSRTAGYAVKYALPAVILCVLGVLTWRQGFIYKDDEALWRDTMAKNPSSAMAYNNLGTILKKKGDNEGALRLFRKTLKLYPGAFESECNIGDILLAQGKTNEGIAHLRESLRINPYYPNAHCRLADFLITQGKLDEAISHYHRAIGAKPDYADAYFNLGVALQRQGKNAEAVRAVQKAISLDPGLAANLRK